MASHVVVIATDLRRTTVRVTPGTYLSDVLEQACKKLNLSADMYLIKHKQKHVDLSIPFRTSGLTGGAKLELVRRSNTPSAVQVALQMPHPEAKEIPGGRLIKKFPSDLTLWKVMRQFESGEASAGKKINITARAYANTTSGRSGGRSGSGTGQLFYETPVLNIMGRELSTFEEFQRTLAQLGHNSGSVLIRLGFRRTERTLYEAMEQISQKFEEAESLAQERGDAAGAETENATEEGSSPMSEQRQGGIAGGTAAQQAVAASQAEEASIGTTTHQGAPKDTTDAMDYTTPSASVDPYQPVNVFLAPTGDTPAAALVPTLESDFTPSIAHAQLHQARLAESSRNKRLLSDKELQEKAAAEAARIAAIHSVLVRIRFPDNTSSEWQVSPADTGAFLYEAVRHVMANPSQRFHLTLPGSKAVIKDDSSEAHNLIKAYKLSGRVLVNLVLEGTVAASVQRQPFLKAHVMKQGHAVKMPDLPQVQDEPESHESVVKQNINEDKLGKSGDKVKIPKWLKLGKK